MLLFFRKTLGKLNKEYSLEIMGDRILESKSEKQQYGQILRTLC